MHPIIRIDIQAPEANFVAPMMTATTAVPAAPTALTARLTRQISSTAHQAARLPEARFSFVDSPQQA
jgi:adenylosuccinate lyase